MAPSKQLPALLGRILYDPALERQAMERIAAHDAGGCRQALAALLARLDWAGASGEEADVVQLLLDVLQRINLEVHRLDREPGHYQANRLALIRRFAGCAESRMARRRFLSELDRLLAPLDETSSRALTLVERAKSHIDLHYQSRLSLSWIASQLNVSASHLSRLFRREAGITLTSYIQRVRVGHARSLLSSDARSISEIAYLVGYQNYRDFYRNFVKYEKVSPRQVRRR